LLLRILENQFNGLDWSFLVKHLEFEGIHNSWLYCFTNPLERFRTYTYGWRCESETRVPSSRGLVKQH